MADVFKQLISGNRNRSQKALDKKTRSFLSSEESDYYTSNKIDNDDIDYDMDLGKDKDVTNHLQDLERISLRDLDTKSTTEQLRILKTEYQRAYDKASHLNDLYITSEKTISNFMIEKRQDQKQTKEMRRFIRLMVAEFPGSSDLKEIVELGSWDPKDVEPLLRDALVTVVNRLRNLDDTIASETESLSEEVLSLKSKILQYRDALRKVEKIKEAVNRHQNGQNTSFDEFETDGDPFEDVSEQPSFEEPEESLIDSDDTIDDSNNHTPHFQDFYEEFTNSYKVLKEEGITNPKQLEEHTQSSKRETASPKKNEQAKRPENKPKQVAQSEMPKATPQPNKNNPVSQPVKPKTDMKKAATDTNHPLSPDFIETEKESIMELFDDNINEYINNLSVNQEFILGIIGRTGLSRNPDLRDYLSEDTEGSEVYIKGRRFDYQSLSNDVANLRDKGILLDERVSLGGNGGSSNMIIFELSPIGKQCFKMLFKDDPVIAEKKRIVEHHSSLEHGYLIKDSAKIFREMGHTVHTDLEKVTFKIDNKSRKVFDFLAVDKDGKVMHIEVERGTHTKEDFFNALNKIYKITKEFYFITPNEKVKKQHTKQKFFLWINETFGGIQNADVVLHITTIDVLRKKKNIWETTDLRNMEL